MRWGVRGWMWYDRIEKWRGIYDENVLFSGIWETQTEFCLGVECWRSSSFPPSFNSWGFLSNVAPLPYSMGWYYIMVIILTIPDQKLGSAFRPHSIIGVKIWWLRTACSRGTHVHILFPLPQPWVLISSHSKIACCQCNSLCWSTTVKLDPLLA